jgi:ankyrin repeat protein
MQFNTESLRKLITAPTFEEFANLTDKEILIFKRAIISIKLIQCHALSAYLERYFTQHSFLKNAELIRNMLLSSTDPKKLSTIFQIRDIEADHDFGVELEQDARLICSQFRHSIFLDKWLLQVPISIQLLAQEPTVTGISKYLTSSSLLTSEEQIVFNKVFTTEKLNSRIFLQKAHDSIKLSLFETQSLIISFIDTFFEKGFQPTTNIIVKPITSYSFYSELFSSYTNQFIFSLVDTNNLQELSNYINETGTPNIINHHTRLSLLAYAVKLQKVEIVDYLISLGADVNLQDASGMTALHYAVENTNIQLVTRLSLARCDLNARDHYKYTPLHFAVEIESTECIRLLLEHGANPNKRDYNLLTPAHHAVLRDYTDAVRLLFCDPKANLFIKNKDGENAFELQAKKHKFSDMKIALFLTSRPSYRKKQSISAATLGSMLMDPVTRRSELIQRQEQYEKEWNPFLNSTQELGSSISVNMTKDFVGLIQRQEVSKAQMLEKFFTIANSLKQLADLKKNGSGYAYLQIIALAQQINQERLSFLAFSFELFRYGFLEQLINLYEKKSVMRVAIESEDTETIVQLIAADPNRLQPQHLIKNGTNQSMTELEFAIRSGKPEAVKIFLDAAKIPTTILGDIPDNALLLAEARKNEFSLTPAFIETKNFFEIDVPKASRRNWEDLLRYLQVSLPTSETNPVHGLFVQPEYEIVKRLVGEKEQYQISDAKKKWLLLIKKSKARQLLTAELAALPDTEENRAHREFVTQSLKSLDNEKMPQLRKYKEQFSFPPSDKYPRNTFKHATPKGNEIKERGELVTVAEMKNGSIPIHVTTPVGSQNNIFFSAGGDEAALTQFRSNDSHVIEVNMTEARRSGLIGPADVYTSPHIPAYNIARVETPIIFIGEDPRIKTVYRMYHCINHTKNPKASLGEKYYKMHWFDYYRDDQLIHSYHYELTMRQEFFEGENIKARAYRFIKILRDIKGPFEEGSFYHYVLNNRHNSKIIETAVAAIFNVYNMEGKVSKNIAVDHPAVKIIENKTAEQLIKYKSDCLAWAQTGDLEKLCQLTPRDINYFEEESLVLEAVIHQKQEIVNFLLSKGAPAYSRTDTALRIALEKLNEAYLNGNGIESNKFNTALSICKLLLYQGSISQLDPEHIHFGASPDNWGELDTKHTWSDKSKRDLWRLKYFLLSYPEFSLHEILLAGTSKQLHALYGFTFQYGLLETHQYIGNRLGIGPLSEPSINRVITWFKEEKPLVGQKPFTESVLKFAFNYAIKIGNLAAYKELYGDYIKAGGYTDESSLAKDNECSLIFSPLFSALRFNQIEIFKDILSKTVIGPKDYPHYSKILQYACLWNQIEAIELLVANNIKLNFQFLTRAIRRQQFDLIQRVIFAVDFAHLNRLIQTSQLEDAAELLNETLNINNETIKISLLQIYKENLSENHLLVVFEECLIIASKENEISYFVNLLDIYLKTINKYCEEDLKPLFNLLVAQSSPECLVYFIQTVQSIHKKSKTIFTISSNSFGTPGLLKILENGNIQNLELLRNSLPNPIEIPSHYWEKLILKISIEMMEYVLKLESFYKDIKNKIRVLAYAVIEGRIDIIKLMFEQSLTKDYLSDQGDSILHLIVNLYVESYSFIMSSDLNLEKMNKSIDYLFNEIDLDPNHRNNSGDTIFISDKRLLITTNNYLRLGIKNLLTRIALHSKSNLNLTNNGYCILHTKIINLDIINKYYKQGGDPNIQPKNGFTPLETFLIYQKKIVDELKDLPEPMINRLKSISNPPSKFLQCSHHFDRPSLYRIVSPNQVRLVVVDNSPIFTSQSIDFNQEKKMYFEEMEGDKRIFYDFFIAEKIQKIAQKSKRLPKSIKKEKQTAALIDLPKIDQLQKIADGIYKLTTGNDFILVNDFFRTVLQLLESMPQTHQNASSRIGYYLLKNQEFECLLAEYQKLYTKLCAIYESIGNGALNSVGNYAQAITNGIPFSYYILKEDGYHSKTYHSALEAAIDLSQPIIVRHLLNEAIKLKQKKIVPDSALGLAIENNDQTILNELLQRQNKITAKSIIESLDSHNCSDANTLHVCVSYLKIIHAPQSIISKMRDYLNSKENKDSYNSIFEILTQLEQRGHTRLKKTNKEKSIKQEASPSETMKRKNSCSRKKEIAKKIKMEDNFSSNTDALLNQGSNLSNYLSVAQSPIFSGKKRQRELIDNQEKQKQEKEVKKTRLTDPKYP